MLGGGKETAEGCQERRYPSNFLALALKTHFSGLSHTLAARRLLKVGIVIGFELALYDIDVGFHVAAKLLFQDFLHQAGEGGSGILEAKRHPNVAVHPKGGNEASLALILHRHPQLVVPRVGI